MYYGNRYTFWDELCDWLGLLLKAAVIVAVPILAIVSCTNSDWYQADQAAQRAKEAADRQPRVVREFDDCKVWAFYASSHWQYVTRCADSVSTETNRTVRQGKTNKTESTTIQTQ